MDKKTHKICDQCDHNMSNKLFLQKLESDVLQHGEMQEESLEQIESFQQKIQNMAAMIKSKKEMWRRREEDILRQHEVVAIAVEEKQKERNELIAANCKLDVELERNNAQIIKYQKAIYDKTILQQELEGTKSKMQNEIGKQKEELKM